MCAFAGAKSSKHLNWPKKQHRNTRRTHPKPILGRGCRALRDLAQERPGLTPVVRNGRRDPVPRRGQLRIEVVVAECGEHVPVRELEEEGVVEVPVRARDLAPGRERLPAIRRPGHGEDARAIPVRVREGREERAVRERGDARVSAAAAGEEVDRGGVDVGHESCAADEGVV